MNVAIQDLIPAFVTPFALLSVDPVAFKVTGEFSVGYEIDGTSSTFKYSKDLLSCTVSLSEATCDL